MSKIVRQSKFRHIFGTAGKTSTQWLGIRASSSTVDGGIVSGNHKFISCLWQAAGGGAFVVLDAQNPTKLNRNNVNLVRGHRRPVLDTAWNPFNANIVASGSEDSSAALWTIPEGGLTENLDTATQTLKGHRNKVNRLSWHPTSNNVLATCSFDKSIKIWDVSTGDANLTLKDYDKVPQCISWNRNGSLFASSCKDKKARIVDPRAGKSTSEFIAHDGSKGFNIAWVGERDQVLTVGHTKFSERELCLWDLNNTSKPLATVGLGISPSTMLLWYDADIGVAYVGGKGDSGIKYFEVLPEAPHLYALSEFKSTSAQKGLCLLPKYSNKIMECETAKFIKLDNRGNVVPISFVVPRKSETFQDDIFPDTPGWTPAQEAADWFGGKDVEPTLVNLEEVDLSNASGSEFKASVSLADQLKAAQKRIAELEAKLAKYEK